MPDVFSPGPLAGLDWQAEIPACGEVGAMQEVMPESVSILR